MIAPMRATQAEEPTEWGMPAAQSRKRLGYWERCMVLIGEAD